MMYLVSIVERDYDFHMFVTEDKDKALDWATRFNDLVMGYEEWVTNHPRYNDPNDEFNPCYYDRIMYCKPYAYVEEVEKR